MDPSQTKYPPMKDLTVDNLTENVNLINSGCKDERLKYLIEALVKHIHDYARETRLSMTEWETAIDFLTKVGQKCTKSRQEFILFSDVIGLSLLVDAIDHPKPKGATDGTVLGPFHTEDANDRPNGGDIGSDPDGEPLLVTGQILDGNGGPIEGASIDVWETDSHGFYDVQYAGRTGPHGRAVLHSNSEGYFWFDAIVPVSYPVPVDGPVGDFLTAMGRHPYRPAHVHFWIKKDGFDELITALTIQGDPYESHDPVFGVKASLVVSLGAVDEATAAKYNVEPGIKHLAHNFVLATVEGAADLRRQQARQVMGSDVEFVNDRPIPKNLGL